MAGRGRGSRGRRRVQALRHAVARRARPCRPAGCGRPSPFRNHRRPSPQRRRRGQRRAAAASADTPASPRRPASLTRPRDARMRLHHEAIVDVAEPVGTMTHTLGWRSRPRCDALSAARARPGRRSRETAAPADRRSARPEVSRGRLAKGPGVEADRSNAPSGRGDSSAASAHVGSLCRPTPC